MAKTRRKLSRPVPVRFEPEDLADLEAESNVTSIDLASLIRSNVKLYRAQLALARGFRYARADSNKSPVEVREEMVAAS